MSERDRPTYEPGGNGDYFWLRFATHFSVGAREYTVEMGIPMPIGASYEEREQLLREADAGMNQLSGHVEEKVARMLQRIQPNQGPLPTPTPSARPSAAPSIPANSQRQTTRPASIPAEQTGPQAAFPVPIERARENRSPEEPRTPSQQQETNATPARASSTSNPLLPLAAIDELTGSVSLPQFITIIRDTMGLNPKQAMELLQVKSLTTINLREALEKLRTLMEAPSTEETPKSGSGATTSGTTTAGNQKPRDAGQEGRTPTVKPASSPAPVNTPSRPDARSSLNIPGLSVGTGNIKSIPKQPRRDDEESDIREARPVYTFDEEEDEGLEDLLEDEDEEEENQLSPQARAQARALINQFRESRGPTVANAARLQVLTNVFDGQLDDNQLLDLIEGIWGVNNQRKLKVDQVELLISWAKTDEFLDEVHAVLTVLEEEM